MKFVLIPDSFKGTLSSVDICSVLKGEICSFFPMADVVSIPVADGGEGTVDAFLNAAGGHKKYAVVKGPYFEDISAAYGMLEDGKTAVIEMAACAGLPLVGENKDPSETTTYGVGQLIIDAVENGADKIIVGLGGSATNDAGCGMASALGLKFYNDDNEVFIPVGKSLSDVSRIEYDGIFHKLKNIEIITMCDIKNPMYGQKGAAVVFGPQKGADDKMVLKLDAGLRHLGRILDHDTGLDISHMPGSGSAGAMGAGMVAFLKSKLQLGIQTVLEAVDFNSLIADADYIITGEGRMDGQSLCGKVISGVAEMAKKQNKPLIVLAGGVLDNEISEAYDLGVSSVFSINRLPEDFSISRSKSRENLKNTFSNILRLIALEKKSALH